MITHQTQSGFTAVELLITLFVAAVFLIAGYQLFSVILQQGGEARNEAKVSSVAYSYLRQYEAKATNPCSAQTESNLPLTIEGVVDARLSSSIGCVAGTSSRLSRITITITYNNPQKSVSFTSYKNMGNQ